MKKELHPSCPDVRVLEDVAAGVCAPELERQTIQHVAQCESCGPRFRGLLRIESKAPMSEAEAAIFKQLKTSSPDMQRTWLAKQGLMANATASGQRKAAKNIPQMVADATHHEIKWLPRLAYAAAGIAAVVSGFVWGPVLLANMELKRADNLVKAAFVEKRTIESRFSGAPAADFRPNPVTLGPNDAASDFERPELAKAQGLVADKVKTGDPRWLQQQGRISLLRGDARGLSDAEKMFETASRKDPNSASLKIDLAVTYYERDSKDEHPNLQKSLDMLLEVLHRNNLNNEDRATALFDLALAYEKTQAWDLAVDTWQKYLDVEKSGPWVEQVKQHLKDAQGKILPKREQGYESPKYFLEEVAKGSLRPEDPEQYFQKALDVWLPQAVEHPDGEYFQAASRLADVLQRQSQDTWLRDFLKASRSRDGTAIAALSAANIANGKGLYDEGAEQAHRAIRGFRASGNVAGAVMSESEVIYAARSVMKGKDCLQAVQPLRSRLDRTSYQWLRSHIYLEESQCENFEGHLAESDASAATSLGLAKQFKFPVLMLRNKGIVAGMKRQQGKLDQSWSKAVEGLALYWKGTYPQERLDQFYSVMVQDALKSGAVYVEEALLRQILAERRSPTTRIQKNFIREGMLHLYLRNILKARNEMNEAAEETRQAALVLDSAAESYAKEYRPMTSLASAQLDLQNQEARQALRSLLAMRDLLTTTQDKIIELGYYRLLGSTYLRLAQLDNAASAYQSAIKLAEESLDNLKNEDERATWLRSTDEAYRGMVRVLVAQQKHKQAFESWEWYESRLAPDKKHLGSKSSVQALPDSSQSRLVYASFPDGIQIWLVKGNSIRSKWVAVERGEFERAVRSFSEKCANADTDLKDIRQEGANLYALLLQPVIEQLVDSDTVVVELDRAVYNLPMEALLGPDGHYFGERYSVMYSPGIWEEESLRPAQAIVPDERLLLLDASHSPQAGFLPGMEAERKNIVGLFPKTKVMDSALTSVPNFQAQLATSDVFHFMGHGKQDGSGTHLVLSDKLTLGAKDFTPEFLQRSRLVVLSACSTSRGEKDGYLDTDSLVHSFLRAGVPNIVSSHWNVDSASSSRLMSSFYGHLITDKSVARAMYNARREMLGTNSHPYYWAGFSVVGRAI